MAKKNIKPNEETPCRDCSIGAIEHNYLIFCSELGHCIIASNKYCRCGKFKKR